MYSCDRHIPISEWSNANLGTQIHEHEEITQLSPSILQKTTLYEAHRILGAGQPTLGIASTGFRTFPSVSGGSSSSSPYSKKDTTDEEHIEEKYEVMLSSYGESGLKMHSVEPTAAASLVDEEYVHEICSQRKANNLFSIQIDINLMKKYSLHVLLLMNLFMIKVLIERKW